MWPRASLAASAALLFSCASLPQPTPTDRTLHRGSDALHAEAVRELAATRHTVYSHRTRVDEASGLFEYDCSGFVNYALSRSQPGALDLLQVLSPRRVTASTYVELMGDMAVGMRIGSWARLASPAELRAGDVVALLAVTKKPDAFGIVNTGHVMIVDAPAEERAGGEWVVPIIDSSAGHGGADARNKEVTGLGRGRIVLVSEASAVVGVRWTETSKVVRTTIVMGRLL